MIAVLELTAPERLGTHVMTDLRRARDELIKKHGAWTAHNLQLEGDLYTFANDHHRFDRQLERHGAHLRRIVQTVADLGRRPLAELRVLDLACLEGLYAIELARHGAEVVGIEGRLESVEKSRFAAKALGLDRATFHHDDVRNLSAEKHGRFDVILCLGILYHLESPAALELVAKIAELCDGLAIFDTHFGLRANASCSFRGRRYEGWSYVEHSPTSSREERQKRMWASLDNETSFWLTRPSFLNLLGDVGFTSAHSALVPAIAPGSHSDRETIVAMKGTEVELATMPTLKGRAHQRTLEHDDVTPHPSQDSRIDKALRIVAKGRAWLGR